MFRVVLILMILSGITMSQTKYEIINEEISKGNFSMATKMMQDILKEDKITRNVKDSLIFEIIRLDRIRKDFKLSEEDVLDYVKKYIPEADKKMIKNWEIDGSLEFKVIDGEKRFFNRSYTNLFRINKVAKSRMDSITGKSKDDLDLLLENIAPEILSNIDDNGGRFSKSEKIKLSYKLIIPADRVPPGELIKCWLPFPREGNDRQQIIDFSSKDKFIVADNSHLQRSVYFEKKTEKGKSTNFEYDLIISTKAENFNIDPSLVKKYKPDSLYHFFTSERTPHIVFTDKIKSLSKEIVENETNPYLIAKRIFSWISNNIPWAGAREYSTILNISDYCITKRYGDCGIKTLLFMTLARHNGIPTKWQSGWMLHPGEKNLHDWCEAYFEGYGWVPVDQSFGLIESDNPRIKYFYLGGIDQYRLTVNERSIGSQKPAL